MEESDRRTGIPKEAWAAIGVVGAAAVTGLVTIIVNHSSSPGGSASSASSSSTSSMRSDPVAAMMGRWEGTANSEEGRAFDITLTIDRGCHLGERCGSIGIPSVPCYGQVFLSQADGDEVEFRVANFDAHSDLQKCQEGAGERFRVLSDGKLGYRTTYPPVAEGVLDRS
ncbi:hypothetical protein [Mycobacterium sp. URHD0025]|uniref:hypothetical protein n=1 Tax=Mycobacterium sp. URHD0025 TaxID=1298864 RepID=UPI0012DC634E|nr:hypothetical protein [Mycobacterium sp. URHD0025]